jgi:hypothetical protein
MGHPMHGERIAHLTDQTNLIKAPTPDKSCNWQKQEGLKASIEKG